ncbi:MAG TPA: ABC transporter substrate-binding protein [Methylomirabilota bacterium]|jgi:peptide/nickel transport system substrate-binding protein|nr:ABC transporter substrate-binding protein [Methylomirabilota bacterium]
MNDRTPRVLIPSVLLVLTLLSPAGAGPEAATEGQIVWAAPFSIPATFFDPAEHQGGISSLMTFYALHDALLKPMPGRAMAPGLAESWSVTRDELAYEFPLRKNVRFHNGDLMTSEDVKFSIERYRGTAAKLLKEKIAAVEIVDPHRVRVRLREPWPDFMTFFGTPATGAAWIVPKSYVQRVGEEGFKKAPVGAGPYRFVSFTPGVELVLEAHEGFWRKVPAVKRLIIRSVPDDSTRLAMLKRGDVDIAYNLRGPLAEEVQRTPGVKLTRALLAATHWVDFTTRQWDARSPWHDRRVRLAAALSIDRHAINQAETFGFSRPAGSIVPSGFEFAWPAPVPPYDPARSRTLLADAGYPNGFDAGDYVCDIPFATLGEAVVSFLGAVGIRARLRPLERAAWSKQAQDKKATYLLQAASASFGNAVTRIERHMVTGGDFAFGSYPEIDELFQQQAREPDRSKRETLLHAIQRIAHERVMFAPIWQVAQLNGVRTRIDQPGIGLIDYLPYSSPYEDLKVKP